MATTSRSGGQRNNLSSSSGRKQRSPTTIAHTGSRVDPSHTAEQAREAREKKSAKQPKKSAAPAPTQPSGRNPNLTAKKKHKKKKK